MQGPNEDSTAVEHYKKQGFGDGRVGFGIKPAVLVVDGQEAFIGTGPRACGEDGLKAGREILRLLDAAHSAGIPVIYTRNIDPPEGFREGPWKLKRRSGVDMGDDSPETKIVDSLLPHDGDVVITKNKPSAFFQTDLDSLLRGAGIDTLIICGATTSGCVRASVVDAFSSNYHVIVPRECVADRVKPSHAASLADIDAKYGDVLSIEEVLEYAAGLD